MTLEYQEIMSNKEVSEVKTHKRVFPRYREFRTLSECDFYSAVEEKVEKKERNEKFESLLAEIYAVDPKTKLPVGDVSQYMSENTNPQIRDFIQTQLMSAFEPVGQSSKLSDDELVRYQRKSDESVRDYVSRMADYVKDDVSLMRQLKVSNKPKDD